MERLHLPDNIKVHFAGLESKNFITAVSEMGVRYGLYSAFQFVYKKLFGKGVSESDLQVMDFLEERMEHVIQDSGLFSLLYGSKSHLADEHTVFKWYDALVEWTLEHGKDFSIVEIDCQDILGTDVAWDLRERLREDLPNHRIINVFHLSDGVEGLDRLIEFSDYIGIGSGTPNNSGATMCEVSSYIKSKKPDCDIHMLGCTIPSILRKCSYCTSSDSIYWKSLLRFGQIGDYHISDLDTQKCRSLVGDETWEAIHTRANEMSTNAYVAAIEMHKRWYERAAGNQDYSKRF